MLDVNESELPFLRRILDDQTNMDEKRVYADWLQTRDDSRGTFLSDYIESMKTMDPKGFPTSDGFDQAWLDLIGYTTMMLLAKESGKAVEYRDQILQILEPAIRIDTRELAEAELEVGVSKYGGHPDLPPGLAWPQGQDCRAIYNDDTEGVEALAGFLMQMSLAEAQSSPFVDLSLPKSGLLSFFCFQDEDNGDCIGVMCSHYSDSNSLQRMRPPSELTEGNETRSSKRLLFRECLRIQPDFKTDERELESLTWDLWSLVGNQTLFGVSDHQTSDLHFIGIDKDDTTTVFVDVSPDISEVELSWVEFDGDSGFK